ncbi:MAG: S8 family serine peptidase [Gammaproteobacteria bacterium]|nr:S8 family serine peptidase [Gammaproteobacteria bacterium]
MVGKSDNFQNGSQDPFEFISSTASAGVASQRLVIVKYAGSDRFLHLNVNKNGSNGGLAINTAGSTYGHSTAVGALSVAAVDVATANGGAFTGGTANPIETYSSDGPRRIFFNADGTPITPGNFSSTGGTVRQKPNIAAADGVATSVVGFNPFFGTSAATPHAGAIAALVKSLDPGLPSAFIRPILTQTALDIEAFGVDRDSGAGILDAFAAVRIS